MAMTNRQKPYALGRRKPKLRSLKVKSANMMRGFYAKQERLPRS